MPGLIATGTIVRDRARGENYGLHTDCADVLMAAMPTDPADPLGDRAPFVVIGPLFAPAGEWTCALTDCPHQ